MEAVLWAVEAGAWGQLDALSDEVRSFVHFRQTCVPVSLLSR